MDGDSEHSQVMEAAKAGEEKTKLAGTKLSAPLQAVCRALADEVNAAQGDPSRAFEVTEGRLVYGKDDGFLYSFKADIALPIPPETPVRLQIEGQEAVKGVLVVLHDFDVLFQLQKDLGENIPRAKVSSEPWFIHDALRKRLEDELEREAGDLGVPLALLGLDDLPTAEDAVAVERGKQILKGLGITSLVPNEAQEMALGCCAGSRLHFVWGPPGTGKTASLAQVVRTLVAGGERCLILAHANAAVDVAMLRVADAFSNANELAEGKVLRVGIPQLPEVRDREEILPEAILARTQPDLVRRKRFLESRRQELSRLLAGVPSESQRDALAKKLEDVRRELAAVSEALREAFTGLVRSALVVGATLSRFAIDDLLWNWKPDVIVIDETSMAGFPFVFAGALRVTNRLLLFGDFRQLPPIFLAQTPAARRWLGRDAFEIAGVRQRIDKGEHEPRVTLLEMQYRMAPEIANLVSELAYGGRLRTGAAVEEATRPLRQLGPWSGEAIVLVDTSNLAPACFLEPKVGSYSRVNPVHAALAISLGVCAAADGCDNFGFITPYRAQARLLAAASRRLRDMGVATAATVHRFQGSERDLILIDLVDAPEQKGASMLTGKDRDSALRLLNVAISRPKGKLLVLADVNFIKDCHPRTSPARKMLRLIKDKGTLASPDPTFLNGLGDGHSVRWAEAWDEVQGQIARDLRGAQGPVYLNLVAHFTPSGELVSSLDGLAKKGYRVVVFAGMPIAGALEETEVDLRLMNRPGGFFALIEGQVSYIGGYSPHGGFARIEDPHLTETLRVLCLGAAVDLPPPSAEAEAALSRICGRCPECGEDRRPRKGEQKIWVLRCVNPDHPGTLLSLETLDAIAQAMKIHCPTCKARAVARQKDQAVFLGCPNYGKGCRGRVPGLDDLFGGV